MAGSGFLPRPRFQELLDLLRGAGYQCVGPRQRDGAIVYDVLERVQDLPSGMQDVQGPGRYRLEDTGGVRLFAWANGPQALKPLAFAPREPLWHATRSAGATRFEALEPEVVPTAVIGVRACDLAALYIHDKHFLHGADKDPYYRARRQQLLLVAVNCTHPAATCFCASTGDGPRAGYGFDIALTELDDGFVVEGRSEAGLGLVSRLAPEPATDQQITAADTALDQAARGQRRSLPSRNLRPALFGNLHHPRWAELGSRCLSCGNCTSVCPTCFCHGEADDAALDGAHSTHYRQWDSCFSQGHSYIHGIAIRAETRERYRQWLTHKLGSWHDQYGRSGCVGCGRCITWCPVGIDITEEAGGIVE